MWSMKWPTPTEDRAEPRPTCGSSKQGRAGGLSHGQRGSRVLGRPHAGEGTTLVEYGSSSRGVNLTNLTKLYRCQFDQFDQAVQVSI